jgi:outer membrane protein
MSRCLGLAALLLAVSAHAAEPPTVRPTISLADALAQADANLPALRQAQAQRDVAEAQADIARAPLLPQVNGTASYQRTTSNFIARPSQVPNMINMTATSSGATFNFFNFGVVLSQTLFDAPTFTRWRAALAQVGASRALQDTTRLDAAYGVRVAFFNGQAARALIEVAKETLANQRRHLERIRGFVEVGTRPEIDLAQARTNVANAEVQLIEAENGYEVQKAQLNQAMGVERDTAYDLGEGSAAPVDVEDSGIEEQVDVAARQRPELAAFEERLRGQALALRASRLGYAPVLGASTQLTAAGVEIGNLGWNWNFQAQLQWNLFGGLLTYSQVKEQKAQLAVLTAQRDAQRLQVRIELERARVAVRAAKATVRAAGEALENARLRAKLAEGRYQAGVGSSLELSDATLALANASAQRVQAELNVSVARGQLLRALGRR